MRLAGAFRPGVFVCPLGSGRGRSLRTEQCACREKPFARNGAGCFDRKPVDPRWLFFEESSTYLRFLFDGRRLRQEEAPLIKELSKMNPASAFRFKDLRAFAEFQTFYGEFDPGSGRTLAACLIHASRARSHCWVTSGGGKRRTGE